MSQTTDLSPEKVISSHNIEPSIILNSLPIIDLSEAENPLLADAFDEKFRKLAREIGFFYLVGHGISDEDISTLETTAKAFFELEPTQKQTINMANSRHFRGYTGLEEETTRQKPDFREQIDIGPELPVDPLANESELWRNLQGPNLWPNELPELKPIVLNWADKNRALAIRVLKVFLRALYQDESAINQLLDGNPHHLLKLIHYPSNNTNPQGVGAHKDAGILTLLLQDSVGGLQVESDNGWINAPYVKNAFIVNIGETLELLTNGYLRANVHRVIAPKAGVSRYSNAFFFSPCLSIGELKPFKLPDSLAKLAKGPSSDPHNPLFKHVGDNAIKGRLRSHLAVTKRFYPNHLPDPKGN
ncbi:isopenicillin N synthase family dioxygenase [Thorsellia anophelis]|uniref:2-oxoglutarate-dependent ethylene/succinate-forming enzyme n=1 Tax=Thorsellia anophelis DSM 18579 TaxID=1123402 RepID=A0A1H9ZXF7_9GAMM|nr:2-oxoglutarate and iron-dependent oxygenase domain-containing protein [Thorsellia anophelis]SES86465.1 Isopenicillin N synthase [Thorsellia anophelis DSM 18579]